MLSYENYLDRVYGGFLGMNAGIRLGVPLEPNPWTYETIRQVFGDVEEYLSHFRRFAADDDANGPVYFVRALLDKLPRTNSLPRNKRSVSPESTTDMPNECYPALTPQETENGCLALDPKEVGNAWLEYTREGKGMFWWGGIGISTEHTAYQNLKNGVPAPRSGSKEQNGSVMAEQIGGQIFVDSWGFLCPGLPRQAARYAVAAASVSHDGEGLHGAAFMAACIAAAFTADSVEEIIRQGLAQIPDDSLYARVVREVCAFYRSHPDDWHLCMEYLLENWGYDRYPGECHIIPNAGVCALALCYGNGDFARTIQIAVMCGWDTDCNAGNVGSIAGVFGGSASIPARYRRPMEDTLVASGISGYLNMVDMPSFSQTLAHAGCLIAGIREPETAVYRWEHPSELHCDFSMKGATHGFLLSERTCTFLRQTVWEGTPCLEIDMERVFNGQGPCRVYRHMFYRREDFDDERYEPVFSPLAYSDQTLSFRVRSQQIAGEPFRLTPYLTTAMRPQQITGRTLPVSDERWTTVTWQLPDTGGDWIHELGFILDLPAGSCASVFMTDFAVTGGGRYRIDPQLQQPDFGEMTPFSLNACRMTVESERNVFRLTSQKGGQAFTGNYYAADMTIQASLSYQAKRTLSSALPNPGGSQIYGALLRAKGTQNFCFAGFQADGAAVIGRCRDGIPEILARSQDRYLPDIFHRITASAVGDRLTLTVDGAEPLSAADPACGCGMVGLVCAAGGTLLSGSIDVTFSL